MGMMGRGRARTRVRFEAPSVVKSALGPGKPGGWSLVEPAMAEVRFGRSQERREAAAEGSSQVATFRVQSTAALRGVGTQHRIVDPDAGVWNITGAAPVGEARLEIEFTAVRAKG